MDKVGCIVPFLPYNVELRQMRMVLSKLTLLVVGHKNLTLINPTCVGVVAIFRVLRFAG